MPIADYKRQAILKWIQITLEMHLTENLNCIPEPQGVDSNKNNSFFFLIILCYMWSTEIGKMTAHS